MTMTSNSTDGGESMRVLFDRLALNLRTAVPCVVEAVSADGTTVDVRPAVSLIQRLDDEALTLDLPVVRGVPIQLLGSTVRGLFVAVPITPGDDGLLVVGDRALDNWQHGEGVAPPPDMKMPRHHDLTDAVFIPGLQRLSGPVPDYPTNAVQVRSRDGTSRVEVSANGTHVRTPDGCDVLVQGGSIVMQVPGGAQLAMNGDTVTITGKLVVSQSVAAPSAVIGGKELANHRHGGVTTGGGQTGTNV